MQSNISRRRLTTNQSPPSTVDARQPQASEARPAPALSTLSPSSPEHDELLLSPSVWHQQSDNTTATPPTATNTPTPLHPNIFRPPPPGLDSVDLSDNNDDDDDDFEAVSAGDSDYDILDYPPPPSQVDGPAGRESSQYQYIPTALRQTPIRQSNRYTFPSQASSHSDSIAAPGTHHTMDTEHDYGNQEWSQAGPNADAQDLAGPGDHGVLECTVTKPQKEGEGTQNVYTSYLLTTNVCLILPRHDNTPH